MVTMTPGTVRLQRGFPNTFAKPTFSGEKKSEQPAGEPKAAEQPANPPATAKKKYPWLLWPLVRIAGYCYTHPKRIASLEKIFIPSSRVHHINRKLAMKYFDPIEPVQFKSIDGVRLDGYWIPSKIFSNKTVILGHGYTADWRNMLGVADGLRKAGFNSFLFDFRCHGTSDGKKSSIGYHEGKDVAGAMELVLNKYPKESKHLFYMGHSMGAASVMMTPQSLAGHPEALQKMTRHFSGFILDSPYRSLAEMSDRFLNKMDEVASDSPTLKSMGKVIGNFFSKIGQNMINGFKISGKRYLKLDIPFEEMKPAQIFSKHELAKKPILLLHGTLDTVAPYQHGVDAHETLKKVNPNIWFITLKDISHISHDWDPLKKGDGYTSVARGGKAYMTYLTTFLNNIVEKTEPKAG